MDIVEQLRKSANTIYKQDGYTFRLGLQNEAADEIERLQGEVMAWWKETEIMRSDLAIYSEQIERLREDRKRLQEILKMWVKFWNEDGDDVWAAEEAMAATSEILKGIK